MFEEASKITAEYENPEKWEKAYTDEDGRMIFKPQGKGAKKDV